MFKDKAPKSAMGSGYKIKYENAEWKKNVGERSDYVFEHTDGRILLSNSFCEEFQEQSLAALAKKTFKTVTDFKSIKKGFTTFHDREAYRLEGKGKVDGVSVSLRVMNTRRNNCYFDFVSISPEKASSKEEADFEVFLKSVEFK